MIYKSLTYLYKHGIISHYIIIRLINSKTTTINKTSIINYDTLINDLKYNLFIF